MEALTLVVRRRIRAPASRVFEAWTEPEQLKSWWGPAGVECVGAEIDLRVGGAYRIGNRTPDGEVVWITGDFLRVVRPEELVYTWCAGGETERVTVHFRAEGEEATEVVVMHARIESVTVRERHAVGWNGCLDGLGRFLAPTERTVRDDG